MVSQILKLDPTNLELKARFIRKSWDTEEPLFWQAYTEYQRFLALAEQKLLFEGEIMSEDEKLRLKGDVE